MILQLDDWIFDIDPESTASHSESEAAENCQCANCRNFYAAVDGGYPQLRPFLKQFGLCIEAPEEMSPIDYSVERIDYDPMYYVFGRILHFGKYELSCGFANILPSDAAGELDGKHIFQLNVYEISLPWVLDEPFCGMDEQPKGGWLGRVMNKLLPQ